jgi:modulator of FtsH protease
METAGIEAWENFFTAQLGAAATLGGLVFVGLSINLEKILAAPSLPNRALVALAVLLAALMMSSYVLIPGQGLVALGSEILCTGIGFAIFGGAIEIHTLRRLPLQNKTMFVGNMVLLAAALLPYVTGGFLVTMGEPAGLYWVAAGIIISFIKAIADAWVLLVEINR